MQQAIPPFFLAGEMAALGASFVWTVALVGFRAWGYGISPQLLNLFKNGVALLLLIFTVLILRPNTPSLSASGYLALSGVIGIALGDTAFFATLQRLGAQLTAVTQSLCPAITALLAWAILGEALSIWEWLGMSLTTGAVMGVILTGGHRRELSRESLIAGVVFALISAFGNGLGVVIARSAFQSVDVVLGTLIRVGAAVVFLTLLRRWPRRGGAFRDLLSPRARLWVLGLSAFAGAYLGLMLMSAGTKYAKAGIATGLNMTYPIWVIPMAVFFLKEKTSKGSIGFVLLAVLGVLLMMYRPT